MTAVPTNDRSGFTLLELLIVVVIIGVLAAIAIPKFGGSKARSRVTAMQSDLRNLVTAQEGYFAEHETYTLTLPSSRFMTSAGVTVAVGEAGSTGWNGTAWHSGTTRTCALFVGDAPAVSPATTPGQVTCN